MAASELFRIWVGAALTVVIILGALGTALVLYQRRFVALHRDYTRKLISAHEEERAYVAREVHDDALQRVALLHHELTEWRDGLAESAARSRATALSDELQDLGVMLRRVAHRLHPAVMDHGGLIPALSQLAEDATRSNAFEVTAEVPHAGAEEPLSRERSLILYRVAQEAIRNISKHAQATRVQILLTVPGPGLTLEVRDNGTGFDSSDPAKSRGLGMISMKERAKLVDGHLEVFSHVGKGTTIRVHVPSRS